MQRLLILRSIVGSTAIFMVSHVLILLIKIIMHVVCPPPILSTTEGKYYVRFKMLWCATTGRGPTVLVLVL